MSWNLQNLVAEQDKNCLLQIRDCGLADYRQILQTQQL